MKKLSSSLMVLVAVLWLVTNVWSENANPLYTCGMHPQIVQDHPGNCPICGMKLTPIRRQAGDAPNGGRKIKYYQSTMKPDETSPTPAKDSLGMDMAPVLEDASESADSSAMAVDAATRQNMNLRTDTVQTGPLRKTIRTVGTIAYNETALAEVTTKFKGWIEKLDVDATGQLVHRGMAMFEIYSPDLYSAEAEYLLALNGGPTNDPGAMVLRETAANKLKFFDVSDAQIAVLGKEGVARKTLSVAAPISGTVIEKNIVQGQMVDAGMRLYRIADLAIIWVLAEIYEQDLPFVQLGQEAIVKVPSLPDREFRGRVTFIYPTVDEKTRTTRVRLEFENPGYFLKPGMFVSAQIQAELAPQAVLAPDSAILRSGAQNTVFVALDGGKFEARDVALGLEAADGMMQVLSGLKAGERIVTSGQFLLDSESQLREAIDKMRGAGVGSDKEAMKGGKIEATNAAALQSVNPATAPETPVYVCPMPEHVSIVYDHPGDCPICGMALVPVTASELKKIQPGGKVSYYTCPMPEHASVHQDKPGKCPLCGMTLIPVMSKPETPPANTTAKPALKYFCPMHPEVISDEPGKCPKCGMDLVPLAQ